MIEGFVGRVGAGKTYLMVTRAWKERRRGRIVFANMSLGWAEQFDSWEQLVGIGRALVLLDEAGVWFNSRQYRSMPPEVASYLMQSRKRGVDLWWSAQHELSVDANVRRNTALIHRCERYWRFIVERTEDGGQRGNLFTRNLTYISERGIGLYDTWEIVGSADGEGRGRGAMGEHQDSQRAQDVASVCLVRDDLNGVVRYRRPSAMEVLRGVPLILARPGWVLDYGGGRQVPLVRRAAPDEVRQAAAARA